MKTCASFLFAFTLLCVNNSLRAQGTAFTYQGQLQNNGSPVNGLYDFRFQLDADPLGDTVLDTVLSNAIPVSNGLFTITIDFGAGWFNGSNYWLEVAVRTNNPGNTLGYTSLTPLQKLTPTPYAEFATTASNVSGTVAAEQLSGTISNSLLPPNPAISGTITANAFAGNGANVTNVNAAALDGLNGSNYWQLGGNTVVPGQFLGSTNNNAVEVWVNGSRALRLEPGAGYGPNVIGGYSNNFVSAGISSATIAGGGLAGATNSVTAVAGAVGGGYNNVSSNLDATVSGGANNAAGGNASSIGGGSENSATGDHAAIAGGQGNEAYGDHDAIGGGEGNYISALTGYSFIGGGGFFGTNAIDDDADASVIAGGAGNTIQDDAELTAIGGGYENVILVGAEAGTIGGGYQNTNAAAAATVAGGYYNMASGFAATVGGGKGTIASGAYSVASGYYNSATNNGGVVSGGGNNFAGGFNASIVGGSDNNAAGQGSAIGGGYNNMVTGNYGMIPGGTSNIATVDSFAAGTMAEATNQGAFVWADSQGMPFGSTGDNQFLIRAGGGVGINTTNPVGALSVDTSGAGVVTIRNEADLVPALVATSDNGYSGYLRFRNVLEVFPNDAQTSSGYLDVRNTNGGGTIALDGSTGDVTASNFIGNGTSLTALNASQLTSGELPSAELSGTYGSAVTLSSTQNSFSGNGSGLTSLAAGNLTGTGTLPLGVLNSAVVTNNNKSSVTLSNLTLNGTLTLPSLLNGPDVIYSSYPNGSLLLYADEAFNFFSGYDAGNVTTEYGGGYNNTAVGSQALDNLYSGFQNTAVGVQTMVSTGTGNNNTANGFRALSFNNGSNNTGSGSQALFRNATGNNNTAMGFNALAQLGLPGIGGSDNIALGYQAGYNFVNNESSNIDIGNAGSAGENNVIRIGTNQTEAYIAGVINGNGGGLTNLTKLNASQLSSGVIPTSTLPGFQAPNYNTIGGGVNNNAAYAFSTVGGGSNNAANGEYSTVAGGENNTANNFDDVVAGGQGNSATGGHSFVGGGQSNAASYLACVVAGGLSNNASYYYAAVGGGINNSASGYAAALAGGMNNTASGNYAAVPGGSNNVASGSFAFAAGQNAQAVHGNTFVWGDGSATTASITNNSVTMRATNGFRFFTGTSGGIIFTNVNDNGAADQQVAWTPGSGSWSFTSDRTTKDRFVPVDTETVLDKVAELPITEWSYKGYPQRHIGAMAQDFHTLFPLNDNDKALNDADLHGVELAAIKGLNQKVENLKSENDGLQEQNSRLQEHDAALEKRLQALEQMIQSLANGK